MALAGDIRLFYNKSGILIRFIAINLFVFVAILLFDLVTKLLGNGTEIISWAWFIAAPSVPDLLAKQPWSVITYMFAHEQFFHFLFNMFMLYFSGIIFIDVFGSRKFPGIYILGGIVGVLFYLLFFNLVPAFKNQFGVLLGASASVMAIFVSVGSFKPHYSVNLLFFGPVKLYVLVLLYVLLDLARLSSSIGNPMGNSGGWLAHIGGASFGFMFGSFFRKSKDITSWFDNSIDGVRNLFSKKRVKKSFVKKVQPATEAYKKSNEENSKLSKQQKIDNILDKISKAGYESLTSGEKEFLFKNSKDV